MELSGRRRVCRRILLLHAIFRELTELSLLSWLSRSWLILRVFTGLRFVDILDQRFQTPSCRVVQLIRVQTHIYNRGHVLLQSCQSALVLRKSVVASDDVFKQPGRSFFILALDHVFKDGAYREEALGRVAQIVQTLVVV